MTLKELVKTRLDALGWNQCDFCRFANFDQGLLSKILNGLVKSIRMESALRLAIGLDLEPTDVFNACGAPEFDLMIRQAYGMPIERKIQLRHIERTKRRVG